MMKRFLPLIFVIGAVFVPMLFTHSCANTTKSPSGGPKDTIPPYIVYIDPLPGATGVPLEGMKIYFEFSEYIKINNAKNIYLSPPQEKQPKARLSGRSVIVEFDSDLDSNTTYTLDLTGAIGDNNEGNMFPGYTLVFSTGERIDSMGMTGLVQYSTDLKPAKGVTVLLYKDHSSGRLPPPRRMNGAFSASGTSRTPSTGSMPSGMRTATICMIPTMSRLRSWIRFTGPRGS